ncbi:hypothetical protein AAG570_005065 [Ranatra chinensis]|uniref:Uncharacterized protein n=1 Tax=Ranatra chinensis TaxID=642074 RepID=A0ABD0YEA6_9HEMI
MASKRRNMFYQNKKQETTEIVFDFCLRNDYYCFLVLQNGEVFKYLCSDRKLHRIDELCGKGIVSFSGSCDCMIAVSSCGKIYGWGNWHSLLCVHHEGRDLNRFEEVCNLPRVVQLACGNSHALALTDAGEVYSWGFNCHGECGQPNNFPSDVLIPTKVDLPDDAKASNVCCSGSSSYVLTTTGKVYSFGFNEDGELGIGSDSEEVHSPTRVQLDEPIKKICDYGYNALALTESHRLYLLGWLEDNHGFDFEATDDATLPLKINNFESVLDIITAQSGSHSPVCVVSMRDSVHVLNYDRGPVQHLELDAELLLDGMVQLGRLSMSVLFTYMCILVEAKRFKQF